MTTYNKRLKATDCNQRLIYECNEGYKLEGSPYVRCSETNWYPPSPPKCVKKSCKPQDDPNKGTVYPKFADQRADGVFFGSNLTYTCDSCYTLEGAEVRQCVSDGRGVTWSSEEPTCNPILCHLPGITNGECFSFFNFSGLSDHKICTVSVQSSIRFSSFFFFFSRGESYSCHYYPYIA